MNNIVEQNLARYLFTEQILNDFFSEFNYCFEKCIKIEIKNNNGKPVAACCKDKYYKKYDIDHPAFKLLQKKREAFYGTPDDHKFKNPVSPCEYHNPLKGCVLTTHKSPICLAFMCRESIEILRRDYNIFEYDYLGVNYALEWILTGDFAKKDYIEFTESIIRIKGKMAKIHKKRT